jgi:hypothetical protein
LRLILFLAAVFILAGLLRRLLSGKLNSPRHNPEVRSSKMVRCAYCQLYVLQDDAIRTSDNLYYCSQDHKKLMINKDG